MRAIFIFTIWAAVAQAAPAVMSRNCSVQKEAVVTAATACRVRAGTTVDSFEKSSTAGYYEVKVGTCEGFLSESCLQLPEGTPVTTSSTPSPGSAAPASAAKTTSVKSKLRRESYGTEGLSLTLAGIFDFARASVSYESTWSKGLNLGLAMGVMQTKGIWRYGATLGFESLGISRYVDGSGTVNNENPTEFYQSVQYVSAGLLGGVRVDDGGKDGDPLLWVELGSQFMLPIGATQSIAGAAAESFTGADRLLLALAGMAGEFPITDSMLLGGRTHLFYNLASSTGSAYFGARFSVALTAAL